MIDFDPISAAAAREAVDRGVYGRPAHRRIELQMRAGEDAVRGTTRNKDLRRLNVDHPDWVELSHDEIRARYWMYFSDRMAFARADVHRRLIQKFIVDALTPIVAAMTRILNKGTAHE